MALFEPIGNTHQKYYQYDPSDRKVLIDLLDEYSEKLIELSGQIVKERRQDDFLVQSAKATTNRLESVMRLVLEIDDQIEANPVARLEFGFHIDSASCALEYYYSIVEIKRKKFKFWNIFH